MKWIRCTVFLLMVYVQRSNNAAIGKYQRFTGEQGLYTRKDDVEILVNENFKGATINSNKAWFVEFYSSWCGFCKALAPFWKEFATDVREWKDLVVIAAIDCSNEQNQQICRDYEVMGYPALRYFREGFAEVEGDYGIRVNKGETAKDFRTDLLKTLISEQLAGHGKHYPNLLPYVSSDISELFAKSSPEVKYAVLVMQEPKSVLGPEMIMDLHKSPNIVTHYGLSNNTDLAEKLGVITYPTIYIVSREETIEKINPSSTERDGVLEAIKEALKQKHITLVLNEAGKEGVEIYEKTVDTDLLNERVKKMGDVVFQMDLETALRYSLKREVGGVKEIKAEKLEALKNYLDLLTKYFPFGRNGRKFLNDLRNYVNESPMVQGARIYELVGKAEKESALVFSGPKKWLGCRGSTNEYRGYPCGLWKLFHYLTVNVADYQGLRGDNPRVALEVMHGYIKNFFGCTDCSQHFQEMAARRDISKVMSFNESIIWLWDAHNEVNKRLSGETTEDPEFPKIQFPSRTNCVVCHKPDGSWNDQEVLKYLKHMYSSINIRYLGTDTKTIHMGLDGSYNASQEGLQEEAVPIQTRLTGKGVSASGTITDKPTFMLSLIFSLTLLYVKKFQPFP